MAYQLVFRSPVGEQTITLDRPIVVGRDPGCDVPIDSVRVSRRHAEFIATPEGVTVRDLGSRNGVFVNGIRVEQATIGVADRVLLGDVAVTLGAAVSPTIPQPLPAAFAPPPSPYPRAAEPRPAASVPRPATALPRPCRLRMDSRQAIRRRRIRPRLHRRLRSGRRLRQRRAPATRRRCCRAQPRLPLPLEPFRLPPARSVRGPMLDRRRAPRA